jgi:chromatin modification-related protein VID21
MRKLAKKRETSVQKQQHAAGMAAMRKANEAPAVRGAVHTPQDFSKLKADREEQMKERLIQLQQRQEAQRRVSSVHL